MCQSFTMRARTIALLALISCAGSMRQMRSIIITEFTVPDIVYAGQADDLQIACHYVGNFTMLQIFKGTEEIFRFKPSAWPAIRGFPVAGIGAIGTNHCGSSECHLQLSNVTEQASGLYRCDLEHDSPPYLYTTRSANITVLPTPKRMPFVDGFASTYSEGEEMQAICRSEPGSMVQWYLNGQIIIPMYGLRTFKQKSTKSLFLGDPPMVKLQCMEERGYTTLGSKTVAAYWTNGNKTKSIEASEITKASDSDCANLASSLYYISILYSTNLISKLCL